MATNPFTYADWNITAQGELVRQWGLVIAQRLAKEAGTTVGGQRPPSPETAKIIIRNFILTKRIGSAQPGGRGYAGEGPPTEDVGQ